MSAGGKQLQKYVAIRHARIGVTKDNTLLYRASKFDCDACALKADAANARRAKFTLHHEVAATKPHIARRGLRVSRERKKIEMLFAH